MPKGVDEYESLVDRNGIWLERTRGIGLLSADDAIALGQSGPVLRASGINWDLRKDEPYLAYPEVDFRVPVHFHGDVYDRYRVHMEEMRESTRIIVQCLDRLEGMQDEPWIADDRKVVLPPREELHTSMESLIHHFKIVTEGYRVPEGEVYVAVESPRGEFGCYVVSDGGPRPWRVKFRAPSLRRARGDGDLHGGRARRRPDRHRRLARHGHGRGRPMSARTLAREIETRSPSTPTALGDAAGAAPGAGALRLAAARRAREVADALGTTPAYCESVASFYDMFHLAPVGRHLVEVCTNISLRARRRPACARGIRGRARRRRRARRREDGEVTLRTVECAGGCGWGTVVAVDHRYREPVRAEDVPAIVEELRNA